ncbi:hypothetical protein H5410_003382 [Solanum commersonii]|uniref:Uncharacterized protein n=1 Tax=Solanum commersonii TaxID=4109 RepID=A0A9J6B4P4_SOLCO|nr:hypothetical protein H5410_003382 [Solanum commersonii]
MDNSFSSRIVRNSSSFNIFKSQGGGATGGTRAIGGVGAGTESVGADTRGNLAESERDLAQISARQDCKGWSSLGSEKVSQESAYTLSNMGLLPLL